MGDKFIVKGSWAEFINNVKGAIFANNPGSDLREN
jgi:hypothetical protein